MVSVVTRFSGAMMLTWMVMNTLAFAQLPPPKQKPTETKAGPRPKPADGPDRDASMLLISVSEPVVVSVDGKDIGLIERHNAASVAVRPGQHVVKAFTSRGDLVFEQVVSTQTGAQVALAINVGARPAPASAGYQPQVIDIPGFIEKNFVGSAPSLRSEIACTASSTASLLQLREPLADHAHQDADEMLLAGDGTHRIGEKEARLVAGTLVTGPRGTSHSIARTGTRPIIVISMLSDAPCQHSR